MSCQEALNSFTSNFRVLNIESMLGVPLTTKWGRQQKAPIIFVLRNRVDIGRICHWVEDNKKVHNKGRCYCLFNCPLGPNPRSSGCLHPWRTNDPAFDHVTPNFWRTLVAFKRPSWTRQRSSAKWPSPARRDHEANGHGPFEIFVLTFTRQALTIQIQHVKLFCARFFLHWKLDHKL